MNISLTYTELGRGRAAILRPAGALDGSTYHDLIARARDARAHGWGSLIVDCAQAIIRAREAGLGRDPRA
jgi:hypothetical protein